MTPKAMPLKDRIEAIAPRLPLSNSQVCGLKLRTIEAGDFETLWLLQNQLFPFIARSFAPNDAGACADFLPGLPINVSEVVFIFSRSAEMVEAEMDKGATAFHIAARNFCAQLPPQNISPIYKRIVDSILRSLFTAMSPVPNAEKP